MPLNIKRPILFNISAELKICEVTLTLRKPVHFFWEETDFDDFIRECVRNEQCDLIEKRMDFG